MKLAGGGGIPWRPPAYRLFSKSVLPCGNFWDFVFDIKL